MADGNGNTTFKQGDAAFVFYTAETMCRPEETYFAVIHQHHGSYRPRIGLTQGWISAIVARDVNEGDQQVWVTYSWPHFYTQRGRLADKNDGVEYPFQLDRVKLASEFAAPSLFFMPGATYTPKLSILTFRWGARNEVVPPEQWGETGSSNSTIFLQSFLDGAVSPALGRNFEVWTMFIEDSSDLVKVADTAHLIFGPTHPLRRAENVCAMYFLYPTAFEENCVPTAETGEDEGAAHVDQKSLFKLMNAVERAGIPTRFPHCSGFYELLTSKRWTHMMTLSTQHSVPPSVALPRMLIEKDAKYAAASAIASLFEVKKQQAILRGDEKEPLPIIKGVAKLGFSWEALDVKFWEGQQGLETAINQLTQVIEISQHLVGQPHDCESLLIQEYCEHDIEMRLYVVDGQIEGRIYTKFCKIKDNNEFGDFKQHFDQTTVANEWMGGDLAALEDGERQCREATKHWMAWIRAQICEVPPAVRFDYFIGRTAEKGKAFMWTLEICELGFSMLGEPDLPKKVFQAMLNSCMSSFSREVLPPAIEPEKATGIGEGVNNKGGKNASKGKGAGKDMSEDRSLIPDDAPETIYIGVPQRPFMTDDQKRCHGEYAVQGIQAGDKPVWYASLEGNERWMYHSHDGYWYIGDHEERAKNFKCDEGYIRGKGTGMPTDVDTWEYYDEKKGDWKSCTDVVVSTDAEDLEKTASKSSGGQGGGKNSQRNNRSGKAKSRR